MQVLCLQQQKKQFTIDEVTGRNEFKLKKKKQRDYCFYQRKKSFKSAENWDRYIKDNIFLKYLYSMAYIDKVKYNSLDFQRKILDDVTNIDVYDDSKYFYQVGFPNDDDRNDSYEFLIIEIANTPIYDCKSVGSVRFLDLNWIKKNRQNEFIVQFKNNVNRALPNYVREGIHQNMTYSRNLHCTHVYKFTCKKILEQKFCNTIMTKKKKITTKLFEYMFRDVIKKE